MTVNFDKPTRHFLHEASMAAQYPGCSLCRALRDGALWIDENGPQQWPTDEEIRAAWDDLDRVAGGKLGPLDDAGIARIRAQASVRTRAWRRAYAEVTGGE